MDFTEIETGTKTVESLKAYYAGKGTLHRANALIERMRDMYTGSELGDWDRWLQAVDADTLAYEPESLPYGGVYKGNAGFLDLVKAMFFHWDNVEPAVKEFCASGDYVTVLLDVTFTTKKSGKTFTMPIAEVWKFEGDRAVEMCLYYHDTHYTLHAGSLSGRKAEPLPGSFVTVVRG